MPLSQLITDSLDGYAIGRKIKDLRVGRKLGLVELGRHTGLSAALLSKIERGKMYPTLPTLIRISLVFSVELDHFFARDHKAFAVVRKNDRMRFPERQGANAGSFYFQSLDYPAEERRFNSYLAEFRGMVVEDVKLHRHRGTEFIYVMEGKLGLYVRDEETTLEQGDSVSFDSGQLHGYRRVGRKRCQAVVVVAPDVS
jgi:transcriptional regulator with XRE-family HTH domain